MRLRRDVLHDDDALVTLGMMIRGPELCTDEIVRGDLCLMRELGLRGSLHAGCGQASCDNGVRRLYELGLMDDDLSYVHACTCSDAELHMIADTGGTISVAATVEAGMPGIGEPVAARALRAGLRPGLSADVEVAAAGDLFGVMRSAHAATRRQAIDSTEAPDITSRDWLAFATIDGARACGLAHRIGSLAPGKAADLIWMRASDINLHPCNGYANAVVAAAHPCNVEAVMVAGRFAKRDYHLVQELSALRTAIEASRNRLLDTTPVSASFGM
ncbi:MAG: amidohydrolase family protein [Aquabacterium sp.]